MFTREQIQSNINALEQQGASQKEIQDWLDGLRDEKPVNIESKPKNLYQRGIDFNKSALKGVGKGILSTLTGMSSLGERGLKATVGRFFGDTKEDINASSSAEKLIPENLRTPQNTAENTGFYTEQIAEFLAPGALSTKVAKTIQGTTKLAKFARLGTRAGIEAGLLGGQTALQKGKIDNDVKTATLTGAIFPVIGASLKGVKALGKPIGEKIQSTIIKPSIADMKDGFKIETLKKFNLGGSLQETATKTHIKLNTLTNSLNKKLKGSSVNLDLNSVLQDTKKSLSGNSPKNFGNIEATGRVLEQLERELDLVSPNKIADLYTATLIKRGAGTKGAWAYGRVEPDASAVEKVYTNFYSKLKTAIEKAAPKEVAGINKDISELIPVSNAVLRRLPIEARNNVISLTDSIGLFSAIFDPRALLLLGANKLSKSGKFAEFLIKAAENESKTSVGQRFFGK